MARQARITAVKPTPVHRAVHREDRSNLEAPGRVNAAGGFVVQGETSSQIKRLL